MPLEICLSRALQVSLESETDFENQTELNGYCKDYFLPCLTCGGKFLARAGRGNRDYIRKSFSSLAAILIARVRAGL